MSTVLLTGGAGYIGSITAISLIENGHEAVIIDNLVNSREKSVRNCEKLTGHKIPFYIGDVRDEELLDRIFTEHHIDAVIHFAGLKAVGESVGKPLEYYDNNLNATISLLRSMKRNDVKRLVFSSSATVYDPSNDPERVEGMILGCSSPYGYTKLMSEQIIRDAHTADASLDAIMLRYFNPVGAHPSGLVGENPQGIPNNLMPYIQQVAVGLRDHLSIFGNDYPTPDGTCIRDYIHVCDLADAHVAAVDYILNNHCLEEINVGNGHGVSVLELVKAFEKANDMTLRYEYAPRRAGDLPEFFANADKAHRLLKWQARRNVEDMCRDAFRYQQREEAGLNDTDIDRALALLGRDGNTLAIVNGEQSVVSAQHGVRPLLELVSEGKNFAGWSAADAVVGKAAAMLYELLEVSELHAQTISEAAINHLKKTDIFFTYDNCVPEIRNRDNTDSCPMEKAVRNIEDPWEAPIALKAAIAGMNKAG